MTKDLDVFIESSPENARAACKALADLGTPPAKFSVDDFSDGKTEVRFGIPPICFEVRQKMDGVIFRSVYQNSVHSLSTETYPHAISPLQTLSSVNLHPVGLKIWPM
jgi:hypothetical protein